MKMLSAAWKRIRKALALACLLAAAVSLTACEGRMNRVAASLGIYRECAFFTSGGFQDYTDYAKYYYDSANPARNRYLQQIREDDLPNIYRHLDDFEGWIEVIRKTNASNEVVVNYDFDRAIMDGEDYIYIESEEHTWSDGSTSFVKYNIYFFDAQTQVLYYFHNNI